MKLLKDRYTALKEMVKKLLLKQTCVSLTIDMWINRQMRSFLGIMCHYIPIHGLQSITLGCDHVIDRHTGENILMWYEEVIASFNVTEKVKHIVTDSGPMY